jgi:NAD(P)-dependent dehydrogenase (short-subunit alcohol dehydrogenase family)
MLLAGCGATPTPTPADRSAALPTPSSVRFDPQGTHVILDDTWRVSLADDRVEVLQTHPQTQLLFAADGRVAQLSARALWIDDQRIPLPAIQSPPVPDRVLHGVWLDLDRLYLHEWHPIKQSGACRIYDRRTAGLTRPARCVTQARPVRLQSGPGDLMLVVEAGVAGPIAALVRFDPRASAQRIWQVDLRPDGALEAAFDPDGAAMHLVSRCALGRARPCVHPHQQVAPIRFQYDLLDATWKPQDAAPSQAVPGPNGQIAWPIAGGFCIRDAGLTPPVCRSLVPGAPSGYTARHVDVDHP